MCFKTYPNLFNNVHACCWRHPFSRVNSTVYKCKWSGNILICLNLNNKKWHHYLSSRTNRPIINDFKRSRLDENWKTVPQLICIYSTNLTLPTIFCSVLLHLHWYDKKFDLFLKHFINHPSNQKFANSLCTVARFRVYIMDMAKNSYLHGKQIPSFVWCSYRKQADSSFILISCLSEQSEDLQGYIENQNLLYFW